MRPQGDNVAFVTAGFRQRLSAGFVMLFALAAVTAIHADDVHSDLRGSVDRIVVDKSERSLYLFAGADIVRTMPIALGLVPEGHKQQEGDFRTPEGVYRIEAKNPDSDYFLSLKISYPNAADRENARRLGVAPGGQIMIHGLPNEPKFAESSYRGADWTDGCIAVSNSDMIDLWLMTPVSTPIEIRP